MENDHQSALLEEYRTCNDTVGRLDNLIWQIAAIIFPISLAGLAFFGTIANHSWDQLWIIVSVSIGSIVLLSVWYSLSRAWYTYQQIAYFRMREIEIELGLLHYRYSRYLRQSSASREIMLKQMSEQERVHFQALKETVSPFPRIGLRGTMRITTLIFIAGWILLVIHEIIYLLQLPAKP